MPESTIDLAPLAAGAFAPAGAETDAESEVLFFFDCYRGPLLRYVCAFGLPVSDAEDLVQEVFLALFKHLVQGGSRANLRGWIFRVAHNMALKRRMRQRREHTQVAAGAEPSPLTLDLCHNPEQLMEARQRRDRLIGVLHALPERDRQCLFLRGDGLRYREIAGTLGISLGAVAKSLARAIARLQRADERC